MLATHTLGKSLWRRAIFARLPGHRDALAAWFADIGVRAEQRP